MTYAEVIERLRQLESGATRGEWHVGSQNDGLYVLDGPPSPAPYDGPIPREYGLNIVSTPNWRLPECAANAAFIAAIRNDAKALIECAAAADELEKALKALDGVDWRRDDTIAAAQRLTSARTRMSAALAGLSA